MFRSPLQGAQVPKWLTALFMLQSTRRWLDGSPLYVIVLYMSSCLALVCRSPLQRAQMVDICYSPVQDIQVVGHTVLQSCTRCPEGRHQGVRTHI